MSIITKVVCDRCGDEYGPGTCVYELSVWRHLVTFENGVKTDHSGDACFEKWQLCESCRALIKELLVPLPKAVSARAPAQGPFR